MTTSSTWLRCEGAPERSPAPFGWAISCRARRPSSSGPRVRPARLAEGSQAFQKSASLPRRQRKDERRRGKDEGLAPKTHEKPDMISKTCAECGWSRRLSGSEGWSNGTLKNSNALEIATSGRRGRTCSCKPCVVTETRQSFQIVMKAI